MKIGDQVKVTGKESIPEYFDGWIGEITGFFFDKAIVQFIPRQGNAGSLSHTVELSDLTPWPWGAGVMDGLIPIGDEADASSKHP